MRLICTQNIMGSSPIRVHHSQTLTKLFTMKNILTLICSLFLSSFIHPEDYQCGNTTGCKARYTEDGILHEVTLRHGDMVSTDAGWSVSTDDGWVKVKTNPRMPTGNSQSRKGYQHYQAASISSIGVVRPSVKVDVFDIGNSKVYVVQPVLILNSASGLNDTGVLSVAPYTPTTYIYIVI